MMNKKLLLVPLLTLLLAVPALALTWVNRTQVFPDGATKDAIVATLGNCGLTGQAIPDAFEKIKLVKTLLGNAGVNMPATDVAKLMCVLKLFNEQEAFTNRDESWKTRVKESE